MNGTSFYMNNIFHSINATKMEKRNISSKTKEIFHKNYRKIIFNRCKGISVSNTSNNYLSEKHKINSASNDKKFMTLINNQSKVYEYGSRERKNKIHIKTISPIKKTFISNKNSSNRDNISFSYITPKKNMNNNSIYYTYSSSKAKTASSSTKYMQTKNFISYKNNIRNENLHSKFNEGRKNLKKTINYNLNRIKTITWNQYDDNRKQEAERMREIKKKNERRQKETNRLLINVQKKKCPICKKLINFYAFQLHYLTHPSQIFPWIYLGNFFNANNIEELRQLKIKYILNCASEVKVFNLPKDINYLQLNIIDHPKENILKYFDKAFSFIELARKNQSNILIHCKLGRSRSSSILIAYMIKYFGYNINKALEFIKSKRKEVNPNYGFIKQLFVFERYVSKLKKNINSSNDNYRYNI